MENSKQTTKISQAVEKKKLIQTTFYETKSSTTYTYKEIIIEIITESPRYAERKRQTACLSVCCALKYWQVTLERPRAGVTQG